MEKWHSCRCLSLSFDLGLEVKIPCFRIKAKVKFEVLLTQSGHAAVSVYYGHRRRHWYEINRTDISFGRYNK